MYYAHQYFTILYTEISISSDIRRRSNNEGVREKTQANINITRKVA